MHLKTEQDLKFPVLLLRILLHCLTGLLIQNVMKESNAFHLHGLRGPKFFTEDKGGVPPECWESVTQ
jgi:hypothetical protein